MVSAQEAADVGKFESPQPGDPGPRGKNCQRQAEQQSSITLNDNPQFGEVTEHRTGHQSDGEKTTDRGPTGEEEKDYSNQFQPTDHPPAPRFDTEGAKDEFGFLGSGELEEQGLGQNESSNDLEDPAERRLGFIRIHGFQGISDVDLHEPGELSRIGISLLDAYG
jgi:hypothetical protein